MRRLQVQVLPPLSDYIILSYSYLIELNLTFVFAPLAFGFGQRERQKKKQRLSYVLLLNKIYFNKKIFFNYIYNRCNLRKDWLHRKSAFVAKRAWRIEQVPVLGCFIKTSLLHTCLYYDNTIISILSRFLFWELLKCCM